MPIIRQAEKAEAVPETGPAFQHVDRPASRRFTLLITGSDTGVGKTRVVGQLAAAFAADGARVQIVKPLETGVVRSSDGVGSREPGPGGPAVPEAARVAGSPRSGRTPSPAAFVGSEAKIGCSEPIGDAERAGAEARRGALSLPGARKAEPRISVHTLASFAAPMAPAAAAKAEGKMVSFVNLVTGVATLPDCEWRIVEGAGGIATPIDAEGRDWADFAKAIDADAIVAVVPDRLGAINQSRLTYARASQAGIAAGIWLNAIEPVDPTIAASTREALTGAGIPLWQIDTVRAAAARAATRNQSHAPMAMTAGNGELPFQANEIGFPGQRASAPVADRCAAELRERENAGLRRTLRTTELGDGAVAPLVSAPVSRGRGGEPVESTGVLNLAGNDYLALARDPAIVQAVSEAAERYGTSASASPLITGWREPHERLLRALRAWHGFPAGLLWSSGYAANAAVLSGLPRRGDLVLADRLIHASMIAGLLRSGARLQRYEHLQVDRLEELLRRNAGTSRPVFVVTESVFSMDGDYPDLARMAELKRRHGFFWIVDEAHALGWYGTDGAGLVRAAGVESDVDLLVGTFGKTLASGGAYTLFRDPILCDFFVNTAGEFIYSTALPPTTVAAAGAALERVIALATDQRRWQAASRDFRAILRADGWIVPEGDSPIVPVTLNTAAAAMAAAEHLRKAGILTAAVRPPTVPAGTSRLRFSLQRTFGEAEARRVRAALRSWKESR